MTLQKANKKQLAKETLNLTVVAINFSLLLSSIKFKKKVVWFLSSFLPCLLFLQGHLNTNQASDKKTALKVIFEVQKSSLQSLLKEGTARYFIKQGKGDGKNENPTSLIGYRKRNSKSALFLYLKSRGPEKTCTVLH